MHDEQFYILFNKFIRSQKIMKWAENILVISCIGLLVGFFFAFGILENQTLGIILTNFSTGIIFACIITLVVLSFTSIKTGTFKIDDYIKKKYNINKLPLSPTLNIPCDYNEENIIRALNIIGFQKIHRGEGVITTKRKFWPLSLLTLSNLFLLSTNPLGRQTVKILKNNNQVSITVSSLYPGIDYETLMETSKEIYPNFNQNEFATSQKNDVADLKPTQSPKSRLKFVLIAFSLIALSILPKIYDGIKNAKIQKNIAPNIITEILTYQPGQMMETGKIYKLFEIPMTAEQGNSWLVGGNVIDGIFYTKCSGNHEQTPCGSFNLETKRVELFDYTEYKNRIIAEMSKFPDQQLSLTRIAMGDRFNYLIDKFAREHSTNYITKAGITVDWDTGKEDEPNKAGMSFGTRVDYRTDKYDYIINCDPLRTSYSMKVATQGMHCMFIRKRNGPFYDEKKDKAIITGYVQPKGLTILENSLIWHQYNTNSGNTEYFMYSLE
ncbi:MAG: hypothetical protein WA057_06195 [Candidatus Magasanikiibacteriota bacterium]